MDDLSTRPAHYRSKASALHRFGLAAVLFFALPAISFSANSTDDSALNKPLATFSGHQLSQEITTNQVRSGQEFILVSARLATTSQDMVQDISWLIRNENGETVFEAKGDLGHAVLPPGNYVVEGASGSLSIDQPVTLAENQGLSLNFILNAGALRVLPRITNIASIKPIASRIYALGGDLGGQLVAISDIPGSIVKLPAGKYRVRTAYEHGNVQAVTDIKVKAGIMSSIDIDHIAGVARLSYVGAPESDVVWHLTDEAGTALTAINGHDANVVLRPGLYQATANIGAEILTAKFEIKDGEARDILLGN